MISDVLTFLPLTAWAGRFFPKLDGAWPPVAWLAASLPRRGGVRSNIVYDPEVTLFYAGVLVGLVAGGLAVFLAYRYYTRSFVDDFFDYVKKRELRKRGFRVPEGVDEEKLALIETNRELKVELAKAKGLPQNVD
jgi:hypothetical protein